jgi:acetylornithine deacetylase/succinyl-diaminopimelate desuccinylase-like protein
MTTALTVASVLFLTAPAQPSIDPTAALLVELIRVDTSNPPGNEGGVANLLAPKFKALGFEVDVLETPQPGKAHFIARLKGNGSKKPVLITAHSDVVGVEREKWTVDPFAGTIKDGYVFGRGAIDFKGGIAVFARAAMMLAERTVPLDRDVIFLAEADEENGRYSTRWLAEQHWDKIDAEFALNEGGWIIDQPHQITDDHVRVRTRDQSHVDRHFRRAGDDVPTEARVHEHRRERRVQKRMKQWVFTDLAIAAFDSRRIATDDVSEVAGHRRSTRLT